jgi:predicted AAA+ superfamily ATPase
MGDYRTRVGRLLLATLLDRLGRSAVVVVTGARQTGKTTLVRSLPGAKERRYVSLDSLTALDRARHEPDLLLTDDALTIDEVQRAPDILLAIKEQVDRDRRPGRFLLTGSVNLLLMRSVGESLAGRASYLVLHPLTEREKANRTAAHAWPMFFSAESPDGVMKRLPAFHRMDWRRAALEGGYPPAAFAATADDRRLWFDGYVDTYVKRDLRDLAQVGDLSAFVRLMKLASLRTGGLLNSTELGRDAGLNRMTAQRWLSILETSFAVTLVPAFSESRAKRLIKAPKVYAGDTGLGLFLADVDDAEQLKRETNAGAWLENLVLNDLLVYRETEIKKPNIFYRRTVTGEEIDFVVERGRRLLPIEIKASSTIRVDDARLLDEWCREFGKRSPFGVLLYDGKEPIRLTRTTIAVPLGVVL